MLLHRYDVMGAKVLKVQEIRNKHVMFVYRKLYGNTRTACLLVTPCTSNLMPSTITMCRGLLAES